MPGNRLELNGKIAATLTAPVLMVLDAADDLSVDDLLDKALVSKNGLEETRCEVLGVIVNKVCTSLPLIEIILDVLVSWYYTFVYVLY